MKLTIRILVTFLSSEEGTSAKGSNGVKVLVCSLPTEPLEAPYAVTVDYSKHVVKEAHVLIVLISLCLPCVIAPVVDEASRADR